MPDRDSSPQSPLLEVRGICRTFHSRGLLGRARRTVAADDVWFTVDQGEVVALVGESGSGKSTLARILLRLEGVDRGEILLSGVEILSREPRGASLAYRGRVQMVFQDPFASLNPVHDVAHHLVRPLRRHRRATAANARERALALLRTVGLEPAAEFIGRKPFELSGGQRQRVAIARALAPEPDLLIADEPTSMLDVSIRMGILNLLAQLKRERGLAILLITHDLASARFLADRVLVLFRGRVVEAGPSNALVDAPAHPYTRALVAAVADTARGVEIAGRAAGRATGSLRPEESGCPYAARCGDVMEICRVEEPAVRPVGPSSVRCHLYGAGVTPGRN